MPNAGVTGLTLYKPLSRRLLEMVPPVKAVLRNEKGAVGFKTDQQKEGTVLKKDKGYTKAERNHIAIMTLASTAGAILFNVGLDLFDYVTGYRTQPLSGDIKLYAFMASIGVFCGWMFGQKNVAMSREAKLPKQLTLNFPREKAGKKDTSEPASG